MGRPKHNPPRSPDILRKGGAHKNRKRETGREPVDLEEPEGRDEDERDDSDENGSAPPL